MPYSARNILDALLQLAPLRTAEAPRDARGLYGLIDHLGRLRYIGSTSSPTQSLHERIHQRHRTGSEGMSHYLSDIYNTGRMWRDRKDLSTGADGKIAKTLRNAFIADHCRAVWLILPDHLDISALEREVLAIAPAEAIAWNHRAIASYDEPLELVDRTIASLGWSEREIMAIERQRRRYLAVAGSVATVPPLAVASPPVALEGEFRFFALDVETANGDRGSICQIGIAGVRHDNSIETWSSYVDPRTERWGFGFIHGITAETVRGAPTFLQLLPVLDQTLGGGIVFQHSSFDATAIAAACRQAGQPIPAWMWRDSVRVARQAWPELKGNGGHGLASLRRRLRLRFKHHDASEDARAAAEVVLRAERKLGAGVFSAAWLALNNDRSDPQRQESCDPAAEVGPPRVSETAVPVREVRHLGTTEITQGNIDNSHIYLRSFFDKFPLEAVGGSSRASSAQSEIIVDWGGAAPITTDLDGEKKLFRKRGWIKEFFAFHEVKPGSVVSVDQIGYLRYRIKLVEH